MLDAKNCERIRQLNTGLQDAAAKNHMYLAQLVLDSSDVAELNLSLAADAAAKAGAIDVIELLFQRGLDTALLPRLAVKNKDMLAVERFIGMFETRQIEISSPVAWSMFKCLLQTQFGCDHSSTALRLLNEFKATTAKSKDLSSALLGALYQIPNNRSGWHSVVSELLSRGAVLDETCLDTCVNVSLDVDVFERVCAGIAAARNVDCRNVAVMGSFVGVFYSPLQKGGSSLEYVHALMRHFDFNPEVRSALIRRMEISFGGDLVTFAEAAMREFDLKLASSVSVDVPRKRL